jgi:energy-coupling factor transport system substrate-specific component
MTFFSTRLLLTCAAIGVAGGLVFGVVGYLHPVVLVTAPVLYGALIGVYFFPGVVAQSLLRRGGVALLTGTIAGLAASTINPQGFWRHVGVGVLIGALQELPFALSGYRYWRAWVFSLAAVVAGSIMGGAVLLALGVDHFAPVLETIYIALFVLSPLVVTWLARLVADGIDSTGAARGVQGERDRRRGRTGTPSPLAMAAA